MECTPQEESTVTEKNCDNDDVEEDRDEGDNEQTDQNESSHVEATVEDEEPLTYHIDEETVQQLSKGLLAQVLPDVLKSKASLDDLTKNQGILLETVHHENQKFEECQAAKDMEQLMAKTKLYYSKLLTVKKDMALLHDRAARLKKTALRFQQQKQKEALMKEQQKEAALEREKQLIAKPAKN